MYNKIEKTLAYSFCRYYYKGDSKKNFTKGGNKLIFQGCEILRNDKREIFLIIS